MSSERGSTAKKGPPKHQNKTAWKPNAGVKINEKELGGKNHPYAPIAGVCHRCKAQIEWRRKYGKYKPLTEPAKCHQCGKRAVRQAYHALCSGCAKERNVCAKCCLPTERIIGRNMEEEEKERKHLEEAVKNLRERDRRTLLRAMSKGGSKVGVGEKSSSDSVSTKEKGSGITKEEVDEELLEHRSDCSDDDDDVDGSDLSDEGCGSQDELIEEREALDKLSVNCGA